MPKRRSMRVARLSASSAAHRLPLAGHGGFVNRQNFREVPVHATRWTHVGGEPADHFWLIDHTPELLSESGCAAGSEQETVDVVVDVLGNRTAGGGNHRKSGDLRF